MALSAPHRTAPPGARPPGRSRAPDRRAHGDSAGVAAVPVKGGHLTRQVNDNPAPVPGRRKWAVGFRRPYGRGELRPQPGVFKIPGPP